MTTLRWIGTILLASGIGMETGLIANITTAGVVKVVVLGSTMLSRTGLVLAIAFGAFVAVIGLVLLIFGGRTEPAGRIS